MSNCNFSITSARDLVSNINNIQIFLNCAPEEVSCDVISQLNSLQYDLIVQLDTVLAGISRGDGVSPC